MTEKEFFVYTLEDELPRFERLLKAVPTENLDYKPDPKSKTAIELANLFLQEARVLNVILETGKIDFAEVEKSTSTSPVDIATGFVEEMVKLKSASIAYTEEAWDSGAQMLYKGHVEWEVSRGKMVFSLLLDLIHHRGQLSTYIRPMGGKVPSIYGPSADSQ